MRQVKCPRCSKMSPYDAENPFRPFCSERCQTIDLGQWASEKYAIPTEEFDPSTEVNEKSDEDDGSEGSSSKH